MKSISRKAAGRSSTRSSKRSKLRNQSTQTGHKVRVESAVQRGSDKVKSGPNTPMASNGGLP